MECAVNALEAPNKNFSAKEPPIILVAGVCTLVSRETVYNTGKFGHLISSEPAKPAEATDPKPAEVSY
eukprot:snap_masked-scaffold_17-processed-gene-3.15-mRNA-1 protein AED:1.00 eAED:1.00 QI:0/-1/0/0/-1/1/1/0/67